MPPNRRRATPQQDQNGQQGTLLRHKSLLLLMDGHAMVHRAFHAIQQPMTTRSTGEEVRGVYGFTNTFLKAMAEWNPTHCAIAFDMRAPTFRHLQYKEYKAQRPEAPPELQAQFPRVRKLMEAFGIPILEMEGFEADDILGTLCRQAEEQQMETVILTGDTDTLQLVSPWVRVALQYSIQERKTYDEKAVRERYGGLEPTRQPDIKALQGDPSDNIPGVPGIGSKTAVKLIQEFGSIEGLYQHLDQVTPPRIQGLLREHRDKAFQGKELTTIVKEMPIKLDLEAMRFGEFDREKVLATLRELEFSSLVGRIPGVVTPVQGTLLMEEPPEERATVGAGIQRDYVTVDNAEVVAAMVKELCLAGSFAFDTETTGLDPMRCDLVGLSFAVAPGRAFYLPVGHQKGRQIPLGEVLESLKPLLEDPSVTKVAHNANFDMTVLRNYDVEVQGLTFDTMVAAQLVGHKAIGLKNLAFQILNEEMTPITGLIGTGRSQITFDLVPIDKATAYAAGDADMTARLRRVLEPVLQEMGVHHIMADVEMPLVPVLVQMQRNGIAVAPGKLKEMSHSLGEQLHMLEEEIYKEVGEPFNINSTQQLSTVMFEKLLPLAKLRELGLPAPKRTKTGYSTDASVLEELKGAHPVVDRVLEYRQLSKLKSTYLDTLPDLVNPRTGRIHTRYNQVGSATGRFSSSDPNLQNIPIRTELGKQVRCAFLAQPGWSLLAADYSQVELRILAHLSQDTGLLAAFHRDEDIHAATASQVYGVPLDQVTPDMRRLAKVMNFGIIYGLSAHSMAQQTDMDVHESATFIESYFDKYPGIRDYTAQTKQQARQRGYVETLLGRRRSIPEINHSNFNVRQAAERMAINMPVQGTAADIIKIAMIRIHQRIQEQRVTSRMLLQVHDELIFEVPPEEMEAMKAMVLELMPSAMELAVPLKVELKMGPTWGDLE
ncbi:DNA polymerase I [Chloroflexota bacterium]